MPMVRIRSLSPEQQPAHTIDPRRAASPPRDVRDAGVSGHAYSTAPGASAVDALVDAP
jgi:hypothetical protein